MTMKQLAWLFTGALAVSAGLWFGNTHAEAQSLPEAKVRVVDLDAVIQKSPKARAIMSEFQRFQKSQREKLNKKQGRLQAEQQKLSASASPDQVAAFRKKVEGLAAEAQKMELASQKKFQKMRQRLLKELSPVFKKFAKERGVGLLLDARSGAVVYAQPSWDQTSELMRRVGK